MIKCTVELYCILFDRDKQKYQVLSTHSEKFIPPTEDINEDSNDVYSLLANLIEKYILISADYIKFIHLEPILRNKNVVLSYFCLIPYNIETRECYKHYTESLVNDFPLLRKITNMA
jgi:hypothetical protein